MGLWAGAGQLLFPSSVLRSTRVGKRKGRLSLNSTVKLLRIPGTTRGLEERIYDRDQYSIENESIRDR